MNNTTTQDLPGYSTHFHSLARQGCGEEFTDDGETITFFYTTREERAQYPDLGDVVLLWEPGNGLLYVRTLTLAEFSTLRQVTH
jgi:hypothetical protein